MFGLAALLMMAAPAGGEPVRARALEPLANWFSDRDYPEDAIRRRVQGTTRFRLVIDQRGNVESCAIERSSGDEVLDNATCSIISIRARFAPARNAAGQAVKDTLAARIRWVLPDERYPTIPFEPIRYVTSLHATVAGETSCSTNDMRFSQGADASECGYFTGSSLAAFLRAARVDASLTAIVAFIPEGAVVPTAGADYGVIWYEADILLGVDRQGRVSSCRLARQEMRIPIPSQPPNPDLCSYYMLEAGQMFEPAPAQAGSRNVRVTETIYARNFPAGDSP